jgi:hypothetical protein
VKLGRKREKNTLMKELKPKERHEQLLANADKEKITQHLRDGEDEAITKIAVVLARQCSLFIHFLRLWQMRVAELDPQLGTERYMQHIYVNRNTLYKKLFRLKVDPA